MPSPTNRITLRATGRADPVLPSPDNRRRKAALASSYQKSRSVDKNRAFLSFHFVSQLANSLFLKYTNERGSSQCIKVIS